MTDRPTERELEELHAQMRLVRDFMVDEREMVKLRRCVYCGKRCYGRACGEHRDLVQIESKAVAL